MLLENMPHYTLFESVFWFVTGPKIEWQQLSLKMSLIITRYRKNALVIFLYTISGVESSKKKTRIGVQMKGYWTKKLKELTLKMKIKVSLLDLQNKINKKPVSRKAKLREVEACKNTLFDWTGTWMIFSFITWFSQGETDVAIVLWITWKHFAWTFIRIMKQRHPSKLFSNF